MTRTMSPSTSRSPHEAGGLLEGLREAVVERPREELLAAVERAGLQQLLGPDDAERLEQLRADHVLAAFAPVERQVRHARVVAPRHPRHERRVLVVGMAPPCAGRSRSSSVPGSAAARQRRRGCRWDGPERRGATTGAAGPRPRSEPRKRPREEMSSGRKWDEADSSCSSVYAITGCRRPQRAVLGRRVAKSPINGVGRHGLTRPLRGLQPRTRPR